MRPAMLRAHALCALLLAACAADPGAVIAPDTGAPDAPRPDVAAPDAARDAVSDLPSPDAAPGDAASDAVGDVPGDARLTCPDNRIPCGGGP